MRLTGGGDHRKAHIHPQGVSSALYLVVPERAGEEALRQGWFEIGRPPPDLALDCEPLQAIRPRPGHLALFPSMFYHGTTPWHGTGDEEDERLTVAFDATAAPAP